MTLNGNALLWAGTLALALLLAPAALARPVPVLPSDCMQLFTAPDTTVLYCYDANDTGCPLYTLTEYKDETGWHKHCIGQ